MPFWILAVDLADAGIAEGNDLKIRSAVSRAYYSVFLLAQQKMRVNTSVDVHAEVIRSVKRNSFLIAQSLYELKEYRQSADYHFPPDEEYKDWHKNWNEVDKKASSLLRKLKTW